ncbi:helix-turn-helix domain-containing protein [Streptomyces sp. TLI_171]|uniref:helix-turn-helix domain-containing protein n=1 Tax=Streptomyces sp. TLI_171 TaxID=1938859 RepID=UPI00217DE144|nr:helix-turn-helix domain-containing protein [Streptomyces sp. TLI_171]
MAAPNGMTVDELLALPAAIDLDTANSALGIGRSTGYGLAKAGQYPVAVLRLGNAYRVVTSDLLRLLQVERPTCSAPTTSAVGGAGLCA